MKALLWLGAVLSCSLPGFAQGVAPVWDARTVLDQFAEQTGRLRPLLDRIQPEQWVKRGAPAAYVDQWKTVRSELEAVTAASADLRRHPDKLSDVLGLLFQHDRLERRLNSLIEGVRQYQNPAVASLLASTLAEGAGSRERLQAYVRDLALTREQEFAIVDREAQRCRGQLTGGDRKKDPK
jgi:hypothetical protein